MIKAFIKKLINKSDFKTVSEKELNANKAVLESLRDYDQGKKDISTTDVRKHLPNIHITP